MMIDLEQEGRSDASARNQRAEEILRELFAGAHWKVQRQPVHRVKASNPDLVVSRDQASYFVEVKTAAEGRSDRLIPLWAQVYLQAVHAVRAAGGHHAPLAVVAAPRIAPRTAEQVLRFAAEYAPDAAAGVIDFAGLRLFRGPHLEGLNAVHLDAKAARPSATPSAISEPADLYSDLNQWMLKVLLAPELPETLLSAPRGRYRNASELARAADVSVMSAFRFVRLLQRDGHLHESAPYLRLVRREELFQRWQAWAAVKRAKEAPMRFLLRGDPQIELARVLRTGRVCLALFAAADALGVGLVHGVPEHVYVPRLARKNLAAWTNILPAEPREAPDLILREALTPQSVFRGLVRVGERPVSDVVQVWLDVASHPARGAEQAELIRRRVLASVVEGPHADER